MDTPEKEPFETRLIAVASIDVRPGHRKPSPKNVTGIAESIDEVGLLQAIGVVPKADGRFDLVFGGNRLAAHRKLKRDVIEARILDIDPADVEAVMHVENLFRDELSLKERLAATAVWADRYKAKHPDSFGTAAMSKAAKGRHEAAREKAASGSEAAAEPLAKEPKADRPAVALGKVTGRGTRQSSTALRVAEKLSPEQIADLDDRGVSLDRMAKIAGIAEPEKREQAVTLIASGMEPEAAIAVAKAPPNATLEHVANPDADGYKPEADMTDDEWFAAYCGETAARLKYAVAYKANAILWRQTRVSRAEFKSKTKRPLSQSKVGVKGPFHYLLSRVVNISHPKDWPICGPCGGSGQAGNASKCTTCNGNAFAIKTEAA